MKFEVSGGDARIGVKGALGLALCEGFSKEDLSALPSDTVAFAELEISRENFRAKRGDSLVVPLSGEEPQCAILAGMGKKEEVKAVGYRLAAFTMARAAARRGAPGLSVVVPDAFGHGIGQDREVSRHIASGAVLAGYRFEKYRSADEDDRFKPIDTMYVPGADLEALEEGGVISAGECWARDLANEPGNVINPETFELEARRTAEDLGLEITVLQAPELERKGMNALLSVGRGSAIPPRLIHLTYRPKAES
ncbi:MAG: hypothetical protein LBI74_09665, partial [Synergistaceae bacterium]|nr:hypothetical protein [Synergistaceae bacterium]